MVAPRVGQPEPTALVTEPTRLGNAGTFGLYAAFAAVFFGFVNSLLPVRPCLCLCVLSTVFMAETVPSSPWAVRRPKATHSSGFISSSLSRPSTPAPTPVRPPPPAPCPAAAPSSAVIPTASGRPRCTLRWLRGRGLGGRWLRGRGLQLNSNARSSNSPTRSRADATRVMCCLAGASNAQKTVAAAAFYALLAAGFVQLLLSVRPANPPPSQAQAPALRFSGACPLKLCCPCCLRTPGRASPFDALGACRAL